MQVKLLMLYSRQDQVPHTSQTSIHTAHESDFVHTAHGSDFERSACKSDFKCAAHV